MEEENHFSPAQYNTELDSGLANVMPESWQGHSRIALGQIADGLSEDEYQFAQELAARLHGKASPEKVAAAARKKTVEILR